MINYPQADQLLHELSQLLAKFNRSYLPKKEDDSHTNLGFDFLSKRIYSRWAQMENQHFILALNLENFEFELLNRQLIAQQTFLIQGKNIREVEKEIHEFLSDWEAKQEEFPHAMHYELPTQEYWEKNIEKPSNNEMDEWIYYRLLAQESCSNLLNFLQMQAEIRIWPHHFDTGIYVEPTPKIGIGYGLAMKDSMAGDAYFYFSPYGLKENELNFKNVPKLTVGDWEISENWRGAIIPLNQLQYNEEQNLRQTTKQLTEWALKYA